MTQSDVILLWGVPSDRPIATVRSALEENGYRPILLDHRIALDSEIELTVGSTVSGRLRIGDTALDLSEARAIYVRPFDVAQMPGISRAGQHSDPWRNAVEFYDSLLAWTEVTPALVVNRPSAMAGNDSKPYQALWIESLGFCIPDTLITTDAEAAAEFWKHHGQVIYKSTSGVRSIVTRLKQDHLRKFEDLACCPTQFQQYIAGQEYRVHVVGDEIFACRVISAADDYRYSSEDVDFEACEVPGEIADRSRKLAQAMNLHLAGLDLRCTPEGTWYCFEVNSSPAFTAYESVTRQPMSQAVARLLASGTGAQ